MGKLSQSNWHYWHPICKSVSRKGQQISSGHRCFAVQFVIPVSAEKDVAISFVQEIGVSVDETRCEDCVVLGVLLFR